MRLELPNHGRDLPFCIRGSKVHSDPLHRKFKTAVFNRCSYPLSGFFYCRVRQAYNVEKGNPLDISTSTSMIYPSIPNSPALLTLASKIILLCADLHIYLLLIILIKNKLKCIFNMVELTCTIGFGNTSTMSNRQSKLYSPLALM